MLPKLSLPYDKAPSICALLARVAEVVTSGQRHRRGFSEDWDAGQRSPRPSEEATFFSFQVPLVPGLSGLLTCGVLEAAPTSLITLPMG